MQPDFGSSPHRLWEDLNPSHDTAWTTRRVAQLASICNISRKNSTSSVRYILQQILTVWEQKTLHSAFIYISAQKLFESLDQIKISTRSSDWLCVFLLHCLAVSLVCAAGWGKFEEAWKKKSHKVAAFLLWLLQTLNRHCWSLMREKTRRRLQKSLCLSW